MRIASIIVIALLAAPCVRADAITIDGQRQEGVYIRESGRVAIVHDPTDGSVEPHLLRDLDDGAIEYLEDESGRAELKAAWIRTRTARSITREATSRATALPPAHARPMRPLPESAAAADGEASSPANEPPASSGRVPRIDLREVPLRTALKAMLRPMGLDYEARDGMVFISSPETLRTESWEPLETRVYGIKNFDATLPKIVVMNPGG